MVFPLLIGGDNNYVLICFVTDPEQRDQLQSLPCEPLQLDDGRGAEGLHVGQLKERVTGVPCGESLRGVDAFKLPAWRRGV